MSLVRFFYLRQLSIDSSLSLFSPNQSEDILLMDLSTEIDSNQNCVKGNPFTSSCVSRAPSSLTPENPFTSQLSFFPTPIHDPFSDDPFYKKSDDQSIRDDPANHSPNSLFNGGPKNGDSDYLGQQFDQLSNRTVIQALSNGHWPIDGRAGETNSWAQNTVPVQEQNGYGNGMPNPFVEKMQNGVKYENGGTGESHVHQAKDSVIICPPPLNTKAGRGRRSVKVRCHSIVIFLFHVLMSSCCFLISKHPCWYIRRNTSLLKQSFTIFFFNSFYL